MAFQPEVMVWPLGRVKTRDQPLTVVVPVFVMVRFSTRPLFHALMVPVTRQAPEAGGVVWLGGVVARRGRYRGCGYRWCGYRGRGYRRVWSPGPVVGGVVVGGLVVGGVVVGVVVLRPKKVMAAAAMPAEGRLWPAPWML